MVERARTDPFFIGWALTEYEAIHDMDDEELASWLECHFEALGRIALCRMPDDKRDGFQKTVQHISGFVSCNADKLIRLLREVTVFSALREESQNGASGLLLAARDRKTNDNPQRTSEDDS